VGGKEIDLLLEALSELIRDLAWARDHARDGDERSVLHAQIRMLSGAWRRLDDRRAALSVEDLSDSTMALERIARRVKAERERLRSVARLTRLAGEAVVIATRVLRAIA
jgi:hypothetical protein